MEDDDREDVLESEELNELADSGFADSQVSPIFQGVHSSRYADHPAELAAARLWEAENIGPSSLVHRPDRTVASWSEAHSLLGRLLSSRGPDQGGIVPSTRDWLVAGTVMQWLGTPEGQVFLAKILSRDYEGA